MRFLINKSLNGGKLCFLFTLVMIGIAAIVLMGYSRARARAKEDEALILQYLDDVYGKDSYRIQRDPKYKYRFSVHLKEYPELEFMITVSRQPLTSPYIWSNFDEVFSRYVIAQFAKSCDLGEDSINYSDPEFVYTANINSLEELKNSYERLTGFIHSVSEKYPLLIDTNMLDIRLDVTGIRLKGDIEDETKYFDVCQAKDGSLTIKPYQEIYNAIASQLKTHPENPNGILFRANGGRTFSLGSDTFEDCLYKGMELKNSDAKELEKIILNPGESSDIYTFESTDIYNFAKIELQAKNLTNSAGSLYDATIIKAVITHSKEFSLGEVYMDLEFDKRREWIDPYEALHISPPKNRKELTEGVSYKNAKVLFEENELWKGIKRVTLTFQE